MIPTIKNENKTQNDNEELNMIGPLEQFDLEPENVNLLQDNSSIFNELLEDLQNNPDS